jgi:multidrug resistance efflux pump
MSTSPAALRTDLVISHQETPEGVVYVVKDPASGRFYRFKEAEHFIARQLDGTAPLETVRRRTEERFGAALSDAALQQFVARLRQVGLIEDPGASRPPRPEGRVRGNPFYLRFKVFDPDRLLRWLAARLGFFFTPWFLSGSGALVLAAIAVTALHGGAIARDIAALFRLDVFLFAWLTILGVSSLHELAHGVTCKRFGGEVHEIGFLLIYLQPGLYCNVSDAWLFPEKSRRLWVTFSGAYFEIVIWAASTLAWRLVEPGTALSEAALVVMATSGIKALFNLNPLIKLDGYYLLSDLLGVPNLRWKSFAYLQGRVGAGLARAPRPGAPPGPPRRERRIYLTYAVLAGAYSVWLLGTIALHLGAYLVGRYQGAGAVAFAVMLGGFFRRPLGNAFRRVTPLAGLSPRPRVVPSSLAPAAAPVPPDDARAPKHAGDAGPADGDHGGAATEGTAPRGRLRLLREAAGRVGPRARLALMGLALLALLVFGRLELKVAGEFRVLPAGNADVRAEVEGLIEEILVEEGDTVRAGDLIARLSDRDARMELGRLEAEIEKTGASLRMLEMGPRPEEVALARKEVEKARTERDHAARQHAEAGLIHAEDLARQRAAVAKGEDQLASARKGLARVEALLQAGLVARQEVEDASEQVAIRENELLEEKAELRMVEADDLSKTRKDLAVAAKEVESADARLRVLLAGARPEEIEAQRAGLAALEAERRHLEEQIRRTRVVAPHNGVVVTPRLKEMAGSRVEKGDLIAEVHAMERLRAEIAVPEKEIGSVRPGQPVVLKSRAFPEKSLRGRVTAVAPAVQTEEGGWGRTIVRVEAEIDAPGASLRSDMTGQAKILCGRRPILELLTRRLTRYLRVEFWSWW